MTWRTARNCEPVPLGEIPVVAPGMLRDEAVRAAAGGRRISAFFGCPEERLGAPGAPGVRLFLVFADDEEGRLAVTSASVRRSFPSMTPECPQAHLFEREIAEQWGLEPEGHPWNKPVRFHDAYAGGGPKAPQIGVTEFLKAEGEEAHEVAVGPVHAGIIEPGHFRFLCRGEEVEHLEISLGYQHRGIERAVAGGPDRRTLHFMETLAGDTTVGHATAYCHALEALTGTQAPPRALSLRGIALELERCANHTGDLGALANDVGYLPTASFCGRLRGDFLNLSAYVCGSRFGRGLVVPGGTGFGLEPSSVPEFLQRLDRIAADVENAVALLWNTPSVMARFDGTGTISEQACKEAGLVGPAARAAGVDIDARRDFASGVFRFLQIPVSTWNTGDVFARAIVRWLEIRKSVEFVRKTALSLPGGEWRSALAGAAAPVTFVVSLVEGWRGEICHAAVTGADGRFSVYKVVDPSFHNWFGLALCLRGQQISDFPLCNKSFNLSYCGHDL